MAGEIQFFNESINGSIKERAAQIDAYVKSLPDSAFEVPDRDATCREFAMDFLFVEAKDFPSGPLQRDEPVFRQGSSIVTVKVYFPFEGDIRIFGLFNGSRPVTPSAPRFVIEDGFLTKTYQVEKQHIANVESMVETDLSVIRKFYHPVREDLKHFNEHLVSVTRSAFDRRAKEIDDNKQASGKLSESKIVLRRRTDEAAKIVIPVQRKPIPVVSRTTQVQGNKVDPEFEIGDAEYNDILGTISSMVKVMERSPTAFVKMQEEELRTILLVGLNGVYEGQATAETFNGYGKTDILIRREDRNAFIAECLIWKGQKALLSKMNDQLFRYAMWRDSKLALIIFNRGGTFSNTVKTMKETVRSHAQCLSEVTWPHETGARYLFKRHDDPDRKFVLTALAFNVPDA